MKRTALLLACLGMLSAGNIFAATYDCADGIDDVATNLSTLSGNTCTLGGLSFGDFFVDSDGIPGEIDILADPFSNVTGGVAYLGFEFLPQNGDVYFTFIYSVTALDGFLFTGIDATLGTGAGSIFMSEIVCKINPVNGCPERNGSYIGGLQVDNNPNTASIFRDAEFFFDGTTDKLWIRKDLQIGAESSLSDLSNSHHFGDDGSTGEVPEPATMLLFSTALLGLGFMRRKKS